MKRIISRITIGVLIIFICSAYMSTTIENMLLTSVVLTLPTKGSLAYTSVSEGLVDTTEEMRNRCKTNLIIEDVYIKENNTVMRGDVIASVYADDVDRKIKEYEGDIDNENKDKNDDQTDNSEYKYLLSLRKNRYTITAEDDAYITSINISNDSAISKDDIMYKSKSVTADYFFVSFTIPQEVASRYKQNDIVNLKYTEKTSDSTKEYIISSTVEEICETVVKCSFPNPTNVDLHCGDKVTATFSTSSENYESIIPLTALQSIGQDSEGRYIIYTAEPQKGNGKSGRYTVVQIEVRVIETNATHASISYIFPAGRYLIIKASKPIAHLQTVKVV